MQPLKADKHKQKLQEDQIIKYLAKTTPNMLPLLIMSQVKVDKTPQEYQALLNVMSFLAEEETSEEVFMQILIKTVETLETLNTK